MSLRALFAVSTQAKTGSDIRNTFLCWGIVRNFLFLNLSFPYYIGKYRFDRCSFNTAIQSVFRKYTMRAERSPSLSLLSVIVIAIASQSVICLRNTKHRLRYEIRHQWDTQPISHPNPAVVDLSSTPQGDLRVSVQGTFFNSPQAYEPAQKSCPERPFIGPWNYEVQYANPHAQKTVF